MSAKERAIEIYLKHIAMASIDGKTFRKTVMDEMIAVLGCSVPSAATHYNTAKKLHPVEGLGRMPTPSTAKRIGDKSAPTSNIELQPEDECYTVLEVISSSYTKTSYVGRTQSFLMQGDASECYDGKVENWPYTGWALIKGLGPNSNEPYRLQPGEQEIKRYINKNTKPTSVSTLVEDESEIDEDLDE
jgi:hypothetical protein